MSERVYLTGTSLAGMSPTRSRAEHDFYATPFEATRAILDREQLVGSIFGTTIPTAKLPPPT